MKYKIVSFALMFFFLFSHCNENKFIKDSDIPQWLKEKIAEDEAIINEDPKSILNYGAWLRYKYDREYFFEYRNYVMSYCCIIRNFEGHYMNIPNDMYTSYNEDKCCLRYVWKADAFVEFDFKK